MSYNSCTDCTANCTHCMCCTRSPLQKPITSCLLCLFRSRQTLGSRVRAGPASLHHPPGGTWVHHHPSPLRGERAARACASRFILLNPPRSGFVHHPRSDSIRGSARDRLLADSVLVLRVYVTPPVLDLFVCALCVACLPPVTLCQQPTASFGRRRLQRKLPVSSVAPGRLPRLAAAGRRRAGRSVRFRKEIFCSTILLKIFPYIHRTHIHR